MYRIVHNDAPFYLSDLLTNRVSKAANYNLRDNQIFQVPFSRLRSFDS